VFKKSLNKTAIVLVLFVVCAGLTSLGIRLPTLSGLSSSTKPKPKPRAVLTNQVKTCKAQLAKIQPLSADFPRLNIVESESCPLVELFVPPSFSTLHAAYATPPRAPPLFSQV